VYAWIGDHELNSADANNAENRILPILRPSQIIIIIIYYFEFYGDCMQ
jgi:hypothetical protein